MPAYLVDITRTISRIGRGFATGIDRVETAYIDYCLQQGAENLFLARLGRHMVLLDRATTADIVDRIKKGDAWGRPRLADALRFKLNWEQRCARSFIKKQALHIAPHRDLAKLLRNIDVSKFEYLNVGHSNLTEQSLSALKRQNCSRISVLIHDMIPLDHPEFSQAHIPKLFEKRMRTVAKYSDRIICNSDDTRKRVASYFSEWGAQPEYLVSHLGIEAMRPTPDAKAPTTKPYYVVLGTIEPRKNHILLFRTWERLEAELPREEIPHLYIVGRRGWDNIEAFQFLDESMLVGKYIFEEADIDDEGLANLLSNSNALLFPSFVEGFGLPALEAAQLNVPVICSNLATFKETLKDSAVYLDPNSPEEWQKAIILNLEKSCADDRSAALDGERVNITTWESHFRHVFG